MNQKTCKLLSRFATATGNTKKGIKRFWRACPLELRGKLRRELSIRVYGP